MCKYYDAWESHVDVVNDYKENTPSEDEIVYAGYTYEGYDGRAIVVFLRNGKLFESNDFHCSCLGLSNWEPEETSVEALKIRKGWPGLVEALNVLCPNGYLPDTIGNEE